MGLIRGLELAGLRCGGCSNFRRWFMEFKVGSSSAKC